MQYLRPAEYKKPIIEHSATDIMKNIDRESNMQTKTPSSNLWWDNEAKSEFISEYQQAEDIKLPMIWPKKID